MLEPDHYAVLGVPREATPAQLRRAYFAASRRHHPDHNPGSDSHEAMKAVNAAWEVLGNPARRAAYDRRNPARDRVAPARAPRPARTGRAPAMRFTFSTGTVIDDRPDPEPPPPPFRGDATKDHYATIGLSPQATHEEVVARFQVLVAELERAGLSAVAYGRRRRALQAAAAVLLKRDVRRAYDAAREGRRTKD